MPESISRPTANELFQKWKQFLDDGSLTTATYVAGGRFDLVEPLQLLINDYIALSAAGVEETLTAAGEPHAAEPQPTLPGFTVLGPLGEGGMGIVYRVRDALDRELALKMARHGQLTQAGRERFLDEAKAMARLDHPHVAPVIYLDTSPTGRPYFVMPIYPGNLTSRLSEYQSDHAKAVRLMAAVADGVAHLHAKGFIHRDLKPQNILLDADGQPAVSDFGLVKSVTESGSDVIAAGSRPGSAETKPSEAKRSRTVAGAAVGTRAYMAPEQAAGLTHLANPRWDVWALGVILHELLTGERPASSEAPQRLLDPNEPDNRPPSEVQPGVDRRLERIIAKCLARNETERYADAGEVAGALRAWLRRPARSSVWIAGLVLIVMAVIGAVVVYSAIGPEPAPQPGNPALRPAASDPVGPPPSPEWAEKAIEYLAADRPKAFTWRLGEKSAAVRSWPTDQALTINTFQRALVEFVPAGPRDTIQIRARARMNERQTTIGRVGVYAGGAPVETSSGLYWAVVDVGFCDDDPEGERPAGERTGRASLAARLIGTGPDNALPVSITQLAGPMPRFSAPRPPRGTDEPYRELVLELTADRAAAWLDGVSLGEAALAELETSLTRQAAEFLHVEPVPPIRLRPDGSAGLIVIQAGGSIDRFRAAPLRR